MKRPTVKTKQVKRLKEWKRDKEEQQKTNN